MKRRKPRQSPAPAETVAEERAAAAVTGALAAIETTTMTTVALIQTTQTTAPPVSIQQLTGTVTSSQPPVTQPYTTAETRQTIETRVETVPAHYARGALSNCAEYVYYGFNTKYIS